MVTILFITLDISSEKILYNESMEGGCFKLSILAPL